MVNKAASVGRSTSQATPLTLSTALSSSDLDPALLALTTSHTTTQPSATDAPIDPALFAIEQVVNDVRTGRIGAEDLGIVPSNEEHAEPSEPTHQGEQGEQADHNADSEPATLDVVEHNAHVLSAVEADPNHMQLDDDGIDPALREIVNSLTNAQQSHHGNLGGADADERERIDRERLQQTLQSTLEDFAQTGFGSYGAIFNTNFAQSPGNHNLMLPLGTEGEAHGHGDSLDVQSTGDGSTPDPSSSTVKRGRGRPKGSKNKPKPGAPVEPPPPPPPKRRGRPPKQRTGEELEDYERRLEEKALGIKRKRGRPRKFPEIMKVRDMRLKKNRAFVNEKFRELEERAAHLNEAASSAEQGDDTVHIPQSMGLEQHTLDQHAHAEGSGHQDADGLSASEVALGEQVAAAVARNDGTDYGWSYHEQSLLEAVGVGVGVGVGDESEAPSAGMAQNDDGMRGVFSLADVGTQ